jgi:hypothetical protein
MHNDTMMTMAMMMMIVMNVKNGKGKWLITVEIEHSCMYMILDMKLFMMTLPNKIVQNRNYSKTKKR